MPINSRYSDQEYEFIMNDIIQVLTKHSTQRDLSIMALGNVLTEIFNQEQDAKHRAEMVDSFCRVLTKTTK